MILHYFAGSIGRLIVFYAVNLEFKSAGLLCKYKAAGQCRGKQKS